FSVNTDTSNNLNNLRFFFNYIKYDKNEDAIKFIENILNIYEENYTYQMTYLNKKKKKNDYEDFPFSLSDDEEKKIFNKDYNIIDTNIDNSMCNNKQCPENSFCYVKNNFEKCYCYLNYTMIDGICKNNQIVSCEINNGGCDNNAKCLLKNNNFIQCICPDETTTINEGVICASSMINTLSNMAIIFFLFLSFI
ncbi:hypothetical protein HEP_00514600, partial [Hepatocystis sp. ex Piliocolobus tephrosceles]